MKKLILPALGILLAAGIQPALFADIESEGPDAGELLTKARWISQGIDQVNGVITIGDADLYIFKVSTPGVWTIDMESSDFDCNLLLFDGRGRGLEGNDPGSSTTSSTITRNLSVGVYYLGCGPNNTEAFDTRQNYQTGRDRYFMSNDSGPLPRPTSERLYGVKYNSGPAIAGDYSLYFSRPTGKPGVRADSRAGDRGAPGTHLGDRRYNLSAAGQTAVIAVDRNRVARLYFSAQNDSNHAGPMTYGLRGISRARYNRLRIFEGPRNITGLVLRQRIHHCYNPRQLKPLRVFLGSVGNRPRAGKIRLDTKSGDYRDFSACIVRFQRRR